MKGIKFRKQGKQFIANSLENEEGSVRERESLFLSSHLIENS